MPDTEILKVLANNILETNMTFRTERDRKLAGQGPAGGQDMRTKKVLVVDDNQLMRKLVEGHLTKQGWYVELCEGPFGVVNKARECKPDVILLDLRMPGLAGDKLAQMLKDTGKTEDIKIISFSSEDESLQKRLKDEGKIDGYFVKGHSFNGLCEEIGRVLGPQ